LRWNNGQSAGKSKWPLNDYTPTTYIIYKVDDIVWSIRKLIVCKKITKKNYKKKMTKCMKKEQKDLIIGTLLGDGNLKTETKGRTWSYRAIHKKEHKEYIEHKYNILKGMCKSEIKLSKIWDKRTKKEYEYYIFNTTVQNSLKFYGNLFYIYDSERKIVIKKVPLKIEKFLTPKAIAYWYMDDGSIKWLGKSNVMRICTENFSFECIQRLKKVLKKNMI